MRPALAVLSFLIALSLAVPTARAEEDEKPFPQTFEAWLKSPDAQYIATDSIRRSVWNKHRVAIIGSGIGSVGFPVEASAIDKSVYLSSKNIPTTRVKFKNVDIAKLKKILPMLNDVASGRTFVWSYSSDALQTAYNLFGAAFEAGAKGLMSGGLEVLKLFFTGGYIAMDWSIYNQNMRNFLTKYRDYPEDQFKSEMESRVGLRGNSPMGRFVVDFAKGNGESSFTFEMLALANDPKAGRSSLSARSKRVEAEQLFDRVLSKMHGKIREQALNDEQAKVSAARLVRITHAAIIGKAVDQNSQSITASFNDKLRVRLNSVYKRRKVLADFERRIKRERESQKKPNRRPPPIEVKVPGNGKAPPSAKSLVDELDKLMKSGVVPAGSIGDMGGLQVRKSYKGKTLYFNKRVAPSTVRKSDGKYIIPNTSMGKFIAKLAKVEDEVIENRFEMMKGIVDHQLKITEYYEKRWATLQSEYEYCAKNIVVDCYKKRLAGERVAQRDRDAKFSSLANERKKIPSMDLDPLSQRLDFWIDRYGKAEKARDAAREAIDAATQILRSASGPYSMASPVEKMNDEVASTKKRISSTCGPTQRNFKNCLDYLKNAGRIKGYKAARAESADSVAKFLENQESLVAKSEKAVKKAASKRSAALGALNAFSSSLSGTGWFAHSLDSFRSRTNGFSLNDKVNSEVLKNWKKILIRNAENAAQATAADRIEDSLNKDRDECAAALEKMEPVLYGPDSERKEIFWRLLHGQASTAGGYLGNTNKKTLASYKSVASELLNAFDATCIEMLPIFHQDAATLKRTIDSLSPVPDDAYNNDGVLVRAKSLNSIRGAVQAIKEKDFRALEQLQALDSTIASQMGYSNFDGGPEAMAGAWRLEKGHPVVVAYFGAKEAVRVMRDRIAQAEKTRMKNARKDFNSLLEAVEKFEANPKSKSSGIKLFERRLDVLKVVFQEIGSFLTETIGDLDLLEDRIRGLERLIGRREELESERRVLAKLEVWLKELEAMKNRGAMMPEGYRVFRKAQELVGDEGLGSHSKVRPLLDKLARVMNQLKQPRATPPPGGGNPNAPPGSMGAPPGVMAIINDYLEDLKQIEQRIKSAGTEDAIADLLQEREDKLADASDDLDEIKPRIPGTKDLLKASAKSQRLAIYRAVSKRKAELLAPSQKKEKKQDSQKKERIVRKLYQDFARAFSQMDASAVTQHLHEDWEADGDITVEDFEENIENSFQVFDSVQMRITGLKIQQIGRKQFVVTYTSVMTGVIRDNDLKHEEKSTHTDTVQVFDSLNGAQIIRTQGKTFWIQ